MADDELSALEEIRARREAVFDDPAGRNRPHLPLAIKVAEDDVPRLLAALDAVLKDHQPGRNVVFGSTCERHESHRHFSITDTEAAGVRDCPDCKATVYVSCTGCGPQTSVAVCPIRKAITSALLGEAKTGG